MLSLSRNSQTAIERAASRCIQRGAGRADNFSWALRFLVSCGEIAADLSRLSFPGYVESWIHARFARPVLTLERFGNRGREDETRFVLAYILESKVPRGEYVCWCVRVCVRVGVVLAELPASCLMSTDSSYAECHALRDRFKETRPENS